MAANNRVTELLAEMSTGTAQAESRLMEAVYPELKRIALRCMRSERRDHSLQATALVNEAYLRLIHIKQVQWQNRVHFVAMASRIIAGAKNSQAGSNPPLSK